MLQVNDAKEIKNTEIAKELSLPPVKLHCSSKLKPLQIRKHCSQNIVPCVEKQLSTTLPCLRGPLQSSYQ